MRGRTVAKLAVLAVLACATASAQTSGNPDNRSPSKESSNSIRPYLVSISVSNLDESLKWYGDNLGFEVVKRKDLPQYSLRIAFAELNGFQLELVEFKQSVSYESIKKQFPVIDDRAKIQGFGKLAFLVDDVEAMAAKLKSKGVKFERNVSDDKEFGVKWFIVTDNDGNWIQFFQKLPKA
jgi:catechol 2,3-dioxygenase-like lactoylglutathione lyase family enzyme